MAAELQNEEKRMKKLLRLHFTSDTILIIILNFFRFGVLKTRSHQHAGYSIVFGIWTVEFQFNISFLFKEKVMISKEDMGHA